MRTALLPVLLCCAVAPATAAPINPKPGNWAIDSRMTSIVAPRLPAQITGLMKRPLSQNYCLSPADAAKGPQQLLRESQEENGDCEFTQYQVNGQKVHALMQCSSTEMGELHFTLDGTFTATRFQSTLAMTGTGAIRQMTGTTSGRYLGPCAP